MLLALDAALLCLHHGHNLLSPVYSLTPSSALHHSVASHSWPSIFSFAPSPTTLSMSTPTPLSRPPSKHPMSLRLPSQQLRPSLRLSTATLPHSYARLHVYKRHKLYEAAIFLLLSLLKLQNLRFPACPSGKTSLLLACPAPRASV